ARPRPRRGARPSPPPSSRCAASPAVSSDSGSPATAHRETSGWASPLMHRPPAAPYVVHRPPPRRELQATEVLHRGALGGKPVQACQCREPGTSWQEIEPTIFQLSRSNHVLG